MVQHRRSPVYYRVLLTVPREVWVAVGRRRPDRARRRMRGATDQWLVSALVWAGWQIQDRDLVPITAHLAGPKVPTELTPPPGMPLVEAATVRGLTIMDPPPLPVPEFRLSGDPEPTSTEAEWATHHSGIDIGPDEAELLHRHGHRVWTTVSAAIAVAIFVFGLVEIFL